MSKPPLFFLIFLAIIALLATCQFMKQRREDAVNAASPVQTLLVEVKSKREFPAPNRRSRQREEIVAEEMKYEASFHPLNGNSDINVALSAESYHQLNKGDKGDLQMQGSRFVSFTPR